MPPTPIDRHPRTRAVSVTLGLLVALATLPAGFVLDDVLMRVRLADVETPWGPSPWWDLYTFAHPDVNAALRNAGAHPWWSDLSAKMTFYRPLSAATHVVDFTVWPDQPLAHHVHTLLWYALAVFSAATVFRRLQPSRAALAALLFAAAASHPMITAWTSARNTLIAFVFACGMVLLHTAGRRLWALALLPLGLLAGEAMLASGDAARPRRTLVLSSCLADSTLTRVDDHTVGIRSESGWLDRDPPRTYTQPFTLPKEGETVAVPGVMPF